MKSGNIDPPKYKNWRVLETITSFLNEISSFFGHRSISTVIIIAENDSKVDVEAFKKKIKNSQVRSLYSGSFVWCKKANLAEFKHLYLTGYQ